MLPFLAFATIAALTFAIAISIAKEDDIIRNMTIAELLQEMYYEAEIGLYPNVYSEELERRGIAS